jgi:Family of unknown function (DUF6174)
MRATTQTWLAGAVGIGLAATAVAGCGGGSAASEPRLGGHEAASTSWTEPGDYSYTLSSSCGERAGLGAFRLWVHDGRVERAKPLSEGADLLPLSQLPTIGDIIRTAGEAQAGGADDVRFVRAPDGRPRLVSIDYLENAVDDELCYRVSRLTVVN